MSKASDVDELLGGTGKPAAKKAAAKTADKGAPAKKVAAKKAAAEPEAPAKKAPAKKAKAEDAPAKRVKEPVVFEEGEREAIAKRVKQSVRKPISSKDLAAKLELPTRKLRQVLYSMSRAGTINVALEASRAAGMTVSPA